MHKSPMFLRLYECGVETASIMGIYIFDVLLARVVYSRCVCNTVSEAVKAHTIRKGIYEITKVIKACTPYYV